MMRGFPGGGPVFFFSWCCWWIVVSMTTSVSVVPNKPPLSMNPPLLLQCDATELSQRLADGRLTSVELMTTTLDWIDIINPSVNAIVSLRDRDDLLAEAAQCDEKRRTTTSPRKRNRGWLHGIPLAIKDNANVAGLRTTHGGSPLINNLIPARSDPYVQRLQNEGGAIILGKTNCPESCLGSHTINELFGPTRHPFHLDRSAGGSSGGAAAAISAHMLAVADGSDMMGSLRNPAGWQGLYSHRPTAGWIATTFERRHCPLPYPISTPGPLGRSVRDLVHMLVTMVGDENVFAVHDVVQAIEQANDKNGRPFRIAWLASFGCPHETGILSRCRDALAKLEARSLCHVTDLSSSPMFSMDQLWDSWQDIRSLVIARTMTNSFRDELLVGDKARIKPELQWEILRGQKLMKDDGNNDAIRNATNIARAWSDFLERDLFTTYDALALPTAQVWPFDVSLDYPRAINGTVMDTYHRWMQISVPASLAGLPVTTIPAGTGGPDGLPMGLQLMGQRGRDAHLLAFAARIATTTGDDDDDGGRFKPLGA
jgi:amidase